MQTFDPILRTVVNVPLSTTVPNYRRTQEALEYRCSDRGLVFEVIEFKRKGKLESVLIKSINPKILDEGNNKEDFENFISCVASYINSAGTVKIDCGKKNKTSEDFASKLLESDLQLKIYDQDHTNFNKPFKFYKSVTSDFLGWFRKKEEHVFVVYEKKRKDKKA